MDLSYVGSALVFIDHRARVLSNHRFGTPAELENKARVDILRDNLIPLVAQMSPKLLGLEGYAYGGPRIVVQVNLGNIIRRCLLDINIPFIEVPPPTLKKWATGHGRASKDDMVAKAQELWPECPDDDNADAFLLALKAREAANQ